MSDPVVHVEFLNDLNEEHYEHIEGLGFVKQLLLVNFLNIEVLVDWDLHYINIYQYV